MNAKDCEQYNTDHPCCTCKNGLWHKVEGRMSDSEFYKALNKQINNLMQGARYIVIEDSAELNEVCMEITRRRKECNTYLK